jgi:hypothetical protein
MLRNRLSSPLAAALWLTSTVAIVPLPLGAANCMNSAEATPTSAWRTITAPKEDVEVVYVAATGWVGLNHIYAKQQILKNKRRILIPWVMPQITTVFPFAHALQAPANRRPLFYVDHSDTAPHLADTGPQEIHLVHLRSSGRDRELAATSGAYAFHFHTGLSSVEIPLKVTPLSDAVFTIQPERSLADGEYLIVLGPVASGGFEFEMSCLQEVTVRMPHIEAQSEKANDPRQLTQNPVSRQFELVRGRHFAGPHMPLLTVEPDQQ